MRSFVSSALHVLGADSDVDRIPRAVPRRLLAHERMLAEHPELHGQVRLVQVAVPSRTDVEAYAELRQQVDALIGRIHGRFGSPRWAPVHYVYRNLSEQHVVALYRAADALLVTPLRDGMNLVAKEFVAARSDEDGVLQANELKVHLESLLSNAPVEVLSGDKVVELRPYGVNNGRVVTAVLAGAPEGTVVAAFGDDRTDEDLFAALPPDALSFHVGVAPSRARLRLASVDDVRALLAGVCPSRPGARLSSAQLSSAPAPPRRRAPPGGAWSSTPACRRGARPPG